MATKVREELDASEESGGPVLIVTSSGQEVVGVVTYVGNDYVEVKTDDGTIDVSLFYVESVWQAHQTTRAAVSPTDARVGL